MGLSDECIAILDNMKRSKISAHRLFCHKIPGKLCFVYQLYFLHCNKTQQKNAVV